MKTADDTGLAAIVIERPSGSSNTGDSGALSASGSPSTSIPDSS